MKRLRELIESEDYLRASTRALGADVVEAELRSRNAPTSVLATVEKIRAEDEAAMRALLQDPTSYGFRSSQDPYWGLKHERVIAALVDKGYGAPDARLALRRAVEVVGGRIETEIRRRAPGLPDQTSEIWWVPTEYARGSS